MKLVTTVKIVITDAANTASCPDNVTGLQDNVTEDVNRAGTPQLVSKVGVSIFFYCHLLLFTFIFKRLNYTAIQYNLRFGNLNI